MKRALALASLLVLGGCAGGYYTDYRSYDGYYAPYGYDGYDSYGYDQPYAPYYYGPPAVFGGGVYYDWNDGRRYRGDRHRDRDDDGRPERNDAIPRAPAERMDPGNVVRPRGGPPGESRGER